MEVGHKEITVVIVLNGNKFSQCAEVIAQMKVSGGAYAAEYYFFLFRHDGYESEEAFEKEIIGAETNKRVNAGLLTYPTLMAVDILIRFLRSPYRMEQSA